MFVIVHNLYLLNALLVAVFITTLISKMHQSRTVSIMVFTLFHCFLWIILAYFEHIVSDLGSKIIISTLEYIPIAILPYSWLLFGSECRRDRTGRPQSKIVNYLWIPCLITIILVWADPQLGLVRRNFALVEANGRLLIDKDYGPWFWVHTLYSYILFIWGTILVFRSIDMRRYRRIQLFLLFSSLALPFVINALYINGFFLAGLPDPTPMIFSLAPIMMVLNHNLFKFLYIVSYARELIVKDMRNAVIILNNENQLVFANAYALELLNINKTMIGAEISSLNTILVEIDFSSMEAGDENHLHDPESGRYFELHCATARLSIITMGKVIMFYDITEQIGNEKGLKQKNSVLAELVQQRTHELSETNQKLRLELERRTQIETKLAHDAVHDPLTGLGNRNLLFDSLKRVAAGYQRDSKKDYCILYIDFDGFKDINDTYGHDIGDQFLIEIAHRLEGAMRDTDSVCRIGGDEFVVLLTAIESVAGAKLAIQRINDAVTKPVVLNDNTFIPSISIGVSFASDENGVPERVLKNADTAMYQAKNEGKNRWVIFDKSTKEWGLQKNQMVQELRKAIRQHKIYPMFLPIVNVEGQTTGWEALARWEHADLGKMDAEQFIHVAEDSNLIGSLNEVIIVKTLELASELSIPDRNLYFSINISSEQLSLSTFRDMFKNKLQEYGLPCSAIRLEISNSSYSKNFESITNIIELMRQEDGILFTLDDFGARNFPLSYLDRMSFETIKIDRSITQRLYETKAKHDLYEGIISLGKVLGKKILAEGVETEEQARKLWAMGVDYCQGWYWGKPVSAENLKKEFGKILTPS